MIKWTPNESLIFQDKPSIIKETLNTIGYLHFCAGFAPQIREQISGPDLHVFTLKFLVQKNWFFPHKKYFPEIF